MSTVFPTDKRADVGSVCTRVKNEDIGSVCKESKRQNGFGFHKNQKG